MSGLQVETMVDVRSLRGAGKYGVWEVELPVLILDGWHSKPRAIHVELETR